ncbi:MAG: M12 family metallo-peptidase [Acidobacteriota bacterium]
MTTRRGAGGAPIAALAAAAVSLTALVVPPAPAQVPQAQPDTGPRGATVPWRLDRSLTEVFESSTLVIPALSLFAGEVPVRLQLERMQVWKPGARVTEIGSGGERTLHKPTARRHFQGRVAGEEDSLAFLAVDAEGRWRGLVSAQEQLFLLATPRGGAAAIELAAVGPIAADWSCGNSALPAPLRGSSSVSTVAAPGNAISGRGAGRPTAADLAVETDAEFFDRLGSASAASAYVADLVAAVSAIFLRDIDAVPQISDLYLYSGGTSSDPWTATSVVPAVFEVRDYWLANRGEVERSLVHFLTGKAMGGGVAFVGSLCDTVMGYGVTGEISGRWEPSNPLAVLDLFTFSHELGHTFGSPHTHCYNDSPQPGDPPIDRCWGSQDGCYSGPVSMPVDGGGIMSYCSLQPGGTSNVSLWLGRAGFYGERSERAPQRMRAYLDSVASCLPAFVETIFENGFETGDTSGWDATVGGP